MLLILGLLLQTTQESTWYYTDAYSPAYLIRRQPWQAIAADSAGRIYVAHPFDTGAENRPVPSGRRLQIFSPEGEAIAQHRDPNGIATFGLALDEPKQRIYAAANLQHVAVFAWEGPGTPITLLKQPSPAKKEGGRCVGVSLGRHGDLFTADLAENKIFRFYPGGGFSSFGSGPGGGEQGFNDLRRIFESPLDGSLVALDADGVRKFSATGAFLKRIGPALRPGEGLLAMGADGRLLVNGGSELLLLDPDGGTPKPLPISSKDVIDVALGKDGRIFTIPRGPEHCFAAYDPQGKLLFRRGADFERLRITLPGTLRAGAPHGARIEFSSALREGLLGAADKKAAELRPAAPRVRGFVRAGAAWTPLNDAGLLPPALEGAQTLRFTTAPEAEGPGPRVDLKVTLSR